jgi:cytochrome c-type biogenesis protein CcmH/NrfG
MSNRPSAHVGQARQLVKDKDYEAAITVLREGLEDDSSDRTAQKMLGVLLFRLKRPDEATVAFRQLTRLDPRDAGTWVNLGAVLNMTKDYKGASDALRKAIQRDKACGVAYYNLAIAQKGLNQAKMAISAYEQCLKLEPTNTEASINLGNLLLEQSKFSKASKVTEAALEHTPKSVKLLRLQARTAAEIEGNQVADSPFGRLVDEKELARSQKALVRRRLSPVQRNREREFMREMARELRHAVRSMVPILDEALPKQMHTLHMAAARQESRNETFAAFDSFVATISELASVRETVTESITGLKAQLNKTDPGL